MACPVKEVNLELAKQKVWLVKVPKFVAEVWDAAGECSEVASVATLGRGEWKLTLEDETSSEFALKERKRTPDNGFAFRHCLVPRC